MLSPLLEVSEHECLVFLYVVDEHCVLVGVAVPVLAFIFVVVVGVV